MAMRLSGDVYPKGTNAFTMFPNLPPKDPFRLTSELYNLQFPRSGSLGERCFDGSVGSPEAREKACREGKVWVLGYFLGCDWDNIPEKQAKPLQESAQTTNCMYWAIRQQLVPATGSVRGGDAGALDGGETWPDDYVNQEEFKNCVMEADQGPVRILTTTSARGATVFAHAVVRATGVTDPYIWQQLNRVKVLGGDVDGDDMYVSKQGLSGPVVLHPLTGTYGHRDVASQQFQFR
eukprot:TRINITY_DN52968_c0_g1_i1.p1 TRINITY_DN52968_c0_g1~~TRINITY_DN52968_c0_g1_i1.p1  ORF type:complete len:235 (-),score=25.78 TRINITY_DN52968_c0_g1_i1:84-788(-)